MAQKDYYELLEVDKNASADDIKRAFRKQAMKYHPDRNPGDKDAEQRFKEINEAYEVLKDEQKRAAYDRYGPDAFSSNAGGGNPFGGGFGFNTEDLSDIFSSVFSDFMGGGRSQRGRKNAPQRGDDLRYDLSLTLEEAFYGLEKEIKIHTTESCEKCHGHGTADGKEAPECSMCHGRGRVRTSSNAFGAMIFESVCPQCKGEGRVPTEKCKDCRGVGLKDIEKSLKIKIPAGVDDQVQMRVSGAGGAGLRGGQTGDLYVFISIKPHKLYERDGKDLYTAVPVSMACAALGGTIEIPGIDGSKIEVPVPAGTQTGSKLRVKGAGMKIMDSDKRGDLFVILTVETPTNLSARQKELLEEFRSLSKDEKCHPQIKTFLDKIKDMFQ
jgi:molecular chaperone DnaJ